MMTSDITRGVLEIDMVENKTLERKFGTQRKIGDLFNENFTF